MYLLTVGSVTLTPDASTAVTLGAGNVQVIVSPFVAGNTSVPNVALSYFDGTTQTVYSDGRGNYSFQVPSGWSGTVTPSYAKASQDDAESQRRRQGDAPAPEPSLACAGTAPDRAGQVCCPHTPARSSVITFFPAPDSRSRGPSRTLSRRLAIFSSGAPAVERTSRGCECTRNRNETHMAASKTEILHALENSMFEFPEVPGRWDVPTFPGVRAHATPAISHLFGNMVGVSTLTEENADAVIAQVQDFFGKRHHSVGWWLNPSSTPIDLVTRLEAAGFRRVIEQAGLVLTDLQRAIRSNPAVTVRPATGAEQGDVIRLYTAAYPLPEQLAALYCDLFPLVDCGRHYLAFLDGVEGPVSVSSMFSPRGSPVAVMQGAATLGEYRGLGIYTSMMAARLADARAMGKDAAVLQGDRKTSAPIAAGLGFEEVCSIDFYAWDGA